MKIHIIGGSGSGKTTLAEKLSKEYGIPHYDLDELQWDNTSESYGVKRDPAARDALLNGILEKDDWIIEGVYYSWCGQCFADADRICLLSVPGGRYRVRIIRRFIRRKLGLESGKRETLRSLKDLLAWADKYQKEDMPRIRNLLAPFADKVIEGPPPKYGKEV